jgi:hypothetical protein
MKRLYPHTRLVRKEYLPSGQVKLVHAGRHKKNTYLIEAVIGRSLLDDPSGFNGGYYASVKKKGGKRELPNSKVRRGLESSVAARMRGESPAWMAEWKDRGKEAKLSKRVNLSGVGMAHWGVPHVIARRVTRAQAHNILLRQSFEPVPGSSRYESHTGAVGRIVDAGGTGDHWNVEVTYRTK